MPTGDFPPPPGAIWSDALGWVMPTLCGCVPGHRMTALLDTCLDCGLTEQAAHELHPEIPPCVGTEEGELCRRDGCAQRIMLEPSVGCTCWRSAPCSACLALRPHCPDCGWRADD